MGFFCYHDDDDDNDNDDDSDDKDEYQIIRLYMLFHWNKYT